MAHDDLPNSLSARDAAAAFHGYTNLAAHEKQGAHVMVSGQGIRLTDEDGRSYIDGLASLWCSGLGFSEERLVEAAVRQMRALPFSSAFAGRSHAPLIELSEALSAIAPAPAHRPFFVNSGSEAMETAIQIVWYYNNALGRPQKKKLVGRARGYHGVTTGAGSLTALGYKQDGFDLPVSDRFLRLTCPSFYRDGKPGETEAEFTARLVQEFEDLIQREGPETIAALVGEPLMAAGGVVVPPAGYWPAMQAVCRKYDILVVADEVVNGFCRTGNWWGSQSFGLEPDIATCAKQLSAAFLPIGATMVSEAIFDVVAKRSGEMGTFGIGMTYGGHPVCAAVAVETLKIYHERDILGHVRAMAPQFQSRLKALADHPLVGETRGIGLIGGVEIVADKTTHASFPLAAKAALKVYEAAAKRGVLLRPLPSDSIGICPPMIVTPAEIDEIFDALKGALDDVLPILKS